MPKRPEGWPILPRLYAILDAGLSAARRIDPLQLADVWLDSGVKLFQLRAKSLGAGEFLDLAEQLADRARHAGATFIVNDRADVAAASGAAGLHVGQDDLLPSDVRPLFAPSAIVGMSTHNRQQIELALGQPVSYIAIGPVFSTNSKANPDPVVGLEGVREAVALAREIPVVAIGGITLETAPSVFDAGASSVAVISDLLVGDRAARIQKYLEVTAPVKR